MYTIILEALSLQFCMAWVNLKGGSKFSKKNQIYPWWSETCKKDAIRRLKHWSLISFNFSRYSFLLTWIKEHSTYILVCVRDISEIKYEIPSADTFNTFDLINSSKTIKEDVKNLFFCVFFSGSGRPWKARGELNHTISTEISFLI